MWTLPLSDRAIIATPTDSHLISLTTGNTIYRMSQGCAPFVISATVG